MQIQPHDARTTPEQRVDSKSEDSGVDSQEEGQHRHQFHLWRSPWIKCGHPNMM